MWVISADAGSILSAVKLDAKRYPEVAKRHGALDADVHYIVVRARVKQAMEYFIQTLDAITDDDSPTAILDSDGSADYKYRTVVTADEFSHYLAYEVAGITYTSHFKEAAVSRQPLPKVSNLYSALIATWNAFSKLQDTAPYAGRWGKSWTSPAKKGAATTSYPQYGSYGTGKAPAKTTPAPAKPSPSQASAYGSGVRPSSLPTKKTAPVGASQADPPYKPPTPPAPPAGQDDGDYYTGPINRTVSEEELLDVVDSVLGRDRNEEEPTDGDLWFEGEREDDVAEDWLMLDYVDEDGVTHRAGCASGWGSPCDFGCADLDEHPSLADNLMGLDDSSSPEYSLDEDPEADHGHPGESAKARKRRRRREKQRGNRGNNRVAGTRSFR